MVLEFHTEGGGVVVVPAENVSHIYSGPDIYKNPPVVVYMKCGLHYDLHKEEDPTDLVDLFRMAMNAYDFE